MMYFKTSFTLLSLLALTGCSSYQEGFDCPAGVGVGCKSLSTVDQMIERGELPKPILEDNNVEGLTLSSTRTSLTNDSYVNEPQSRLIGSEFSSPSTIVRNPEQSLRVWIKGYTDDQGNYHDHAVIYTVVQPASWQVDGLTPSHLRQTRPTALPTPLHGEVNHES